VARILILEDSELDCKLYTKTLGAKHVLEFHDSSLNFLGHCSRFRPQVILLDVQLNNSSGFSAMEELQKSNANAPPVFFVSGSIEAEQKIRALKLGAHDYLTKPILASELELKIANTLQRNSSPSIEEELHTCNGPLTPNSSSQHLELSTGDGSNAAQVLLTSQESRLLKLFLDKPNQVFSREEILQRIWGSNIHVVDRVVDTLVSALRKKCQPFGKHFESVYGVGYRFKSF
jgi:DNA-binding response OmpR family regulator